MQTTVHGSRRRDRHRRHHGVGCVRPCHRRDRCARRPDQRRVPRIRRVRRARSDDGRRGDGARRAAARADPRRRRRRAPARMHPLPVPRPHDQRRDGRERHLGQLRRRDRVRGDAPPRRTRTAARRRAGRDATGSSRAATSRRSASSARSCSAPNSTTPSSGTPTKTRFTDRPGRFPTVPPPHQPWKRRSTMARPDGRTDDQLRPITFERDFTEMADGSCLVSFGKTRVLCTASIDDDVPRWMKNSGKGWVTAEYSMLPGASPERIDREAARGKQSGRTVEIQRLIGRVAAGGVRHEGARRASGRRRLRRAPGRRRHPHRQHLRRIRRPARRARTGGAARRSSGEPAALVLHGDQRRHRRRYAGPRPALRRGQHAPRST